MLRLHPSQTQTRLILSLLILGLLLTVAVNSQAQTPDAPMMGRYEFWCDWGAQVIVQQPAEETPPDSVVTNEPSAVTPDADWDQLVIELLWNDPIFDTANPCEAIRAFFESDEKPDMIVEEVEALMLTSYPPQLSLVVKGFYPDGCTFPLRTVRLHQGEEITIRIHRVIDPAAACLMMLTPFETSLGFGFLAPGQYEFSINGFDYPLDWEY
jgi:hypothetical protein